LKPDERDRSPKGNGSARSATGPSITPAGANSNNLYR
jgi:hypothetical protein